jgi:hypothetical protein
MKFKRTAYIITFITNILLLVFTVVPHHHHYNKSQICVINSHCQTDDTDSNENHQHDNHSKSNSCLLSQAIVLPLSNNTKESQSIVYDYGFDVYIITSHELFDKYLTLNPIEILTPRTPLSFSSYINSSLGLRAPPVI